MLKYSRNFVFLSIMAGLVSILALYPRQAEAQQINQTIIRSLDLYITSKCVDGVAIFQVRNVGARKLKSLNFKLFKVKQNLVVSKRRMTLSKGQIATFQVKNAAIIPDQIGLFVNSKDFPRTHQADISVKCSN